VSVQPGRWLVLTVRTADPELLPLAAEVLAPHGGGAVLEADGGLVAYAPEPADVHAFVRDLAGRLITELPESAVPRLDWEWQENQDWARKWKEGLAPRQVTERIVVKPTWSEWEARPGQVVIDIDPQMAFGTGEHATTRGCLRLLDDVLRPGDRVLDVGSGSAILAIAAARLGAREVMAVEYDPDANLNARENLEGNGVEDRVQVVERMADPALLDELGRFDVVLANILSGVIRPLLPAFRAALGGAGEGRLIVSGILRTEAPGVVHDAEAAGFRVAQADEEEEWWSALLRPV
jgi:ribosomal protein L11 methyltransferase